MDREDLLARMVATSVSDRHFNDWPDVLSDYAECLLALEKRLAPEELERLIQIGADFYRTLARAEQYRSMSVWRDANP